MSKIISKSILVCGYERIVSMYLNTPCPADCFIPKEDKANLLVTWTISKEEATSTRAVDILRYYFVPKRINLFSNSIRQEFRISHLPNKDEKKGDDEFLFEWEIHLGKKAVDGGVLFSVLENKLFN